MHKNCPASIDLDAGQFSSLKIISQRTASQRTGLVSAALYRRRPSSVCTKEMCPDYGVKKRNML